MGDPPNKQKQLRDQPNDSRCPRARTIHQWKPTLIADDRDALLRALKGKMGRLPLYDVYEVKAHESS